MIFLIIFSSKAILNLSDYVGNFLTEEKNGFNTNQLKFGIGYRF